MGGDRDDALVGGRYNFGTSDRVSEANWNIWGDCSTYPIQIDQTTNIQMERQLLERQNLTIWDLLRQVRRANVYSQHLLLAQGAFEKADTEI